LAVSAVGPQPVFFYDLASAECYLAAEQVMTALPTVPEWEPVLGMELAGGAVLPDRELVERVAAELELQPLRWPPAVPPDSRRAMLAATYAKRVGRGVAFSLAAFRQAFAGGRDLGDENTVLIAAAACEMHPTALLKGMSLRSVTDAMSAAQARAVSAGVMTLPAIVAGDEVFQGFDAVGAAAARLGARL
jgi:2-hydroxychromene-2-carboxylate isomerase